MKIIRVFPRRTKATPTDDLVRINTGPGLFDVADEVHISVAFTWDRKRAERLAYEWEKVAPVKTGGPALNEPGTDFVPGMYLKPGYVITSRGCPNRCWFCEVPKREGGTIRELPIMDGCNLLDDNLLACSDTHIKNVFAMLARQKRESIEFTGGIEAARLKPWHAEAMKRLNPKQVFFAYDTPDDLELLKNAARTMISAGFTTKSHALRCYVLCGYPKDTIEAAEIRMRETMSAGFTPMAMLYRDKEGYRNPDWIGNKFQRRWARPAIINSRKQGVN